MIDVVNDAEGVRMALEEIFEQDYVRSRIDRESAGANAETRERMAFQVPPRTLSPGYYDFAQHLLRLEAQQKAGIGFSAVDLASFEASGLVALGRARGGFEIDLNWADSKLTSATIRSKGGTTCHVVYGDKTQDITLAPGGTTQLSFN